MYTPHLRLNRLGINAAPGLVAPGDPYVEQAHL